jgi:transposase
MRAYSVDLRERVVAAVRGQGFSQVQAAKVFGLGRASVGRFVRTSQAGRSLVPLKSRGRPRTVRLPEHVEALREHLESEPDMELAERSEHLEKQEGIFLSVSTLWRELRDLGWTRKKRLSAPANRIR